MQSQTLAFAASSSSIEGLWEIPQDKTLIQVISHGDTIEGVIYRRPRLRTDEIDKFNPDPQLRRRSLIGLKVLWNLKQAAPGVWKGGVIYDPDSGHTYSAQARMTGPDSLEFRGYILIPLLGRSEKLKRYPVASPLKNVAMIPKNTGP